jgi:hypothetical protein
LVLNGRGFGSRTRHLQCPGVDGIEGFVAIFPEVNGVLKVFFVMLLWVGRGLNANFLWALSIEEMDYCSRRFA